MWYNIRYLDEYILKFIRICINVLLCVANTHALKRTPY